VSYPASPLAAQSPFHGSAWGGLGETRREGVSRASRGRIAASHGYGSSTRRASKRWNRMHPARPFHHALGGRRHGCRAPGVAA